MKMFPRHCTIHQSIIVVMYFGGHALIRMEESGIKIAG